jgi:hypothetical protein
MATLPRKRLSAGVPESADHDPIKGVLSEIPTGDIASVEVIKRAAMHLGPNPVSIIWITLKTGAKVPVDPAR